MVGAGPALLAPTGKAIAMPVSSDVTPRTRALLACGVTAALLYAVAHDVLAVLLYDGYSLTDQTLSELTSVGAPTRPAALAVEGVSDLLLVAFGAGVWRTARGRSLRVAAGCLIGYGALFPLWLPFPMTGRGEGQAPGLSDVMHVALGTITIVLMLTAIASAARCSAASFRTFSWAAFAAVLVLWSWSGAYGGRIAAGDPTPWLGVVERGAMAAWLFWVAALSVHLLRSPRTPSNRPEVDADTLPAAARLSGRGAG